ncbi:hypothetical protein C8F01DRAFT_120785 [Mycena amicta]|nr:hypothetical protein C8F01DRAFT_120785 [Mycena amicta]
MTRMARSGNTWRTWKTPIQLACYERRYQDLERDTLLRQRRGLEASQDRPTYRERDNPGAPPGIAHHLTVLGPHAARAEGKETRVDGWEDGLRAPTLERNAVELVTTSQHPRFHRLHYRRCTPTRRSPARRRPSRLPNPPALLPWHKYNAPSAGSSAEERQASCAGSSAAEMEGERDRPFGTTTSPQFS